VVTAESVRGEGAGRALMRAAMRAVTTHFGEGTAIALSAQSYLLPFYTSLGFKATSEEYLEDDIPHTDMIRS
jgi:ElaA protein